jgi:hypothetical protein
LAFGALLLIIGTSQLPAQQSNILSNIEIINSRAKLMSDYARDFLDFMKALEGNTIEYEMASNFYVATSQTRDYLDAASDLLFVYSYISSKNDRSVVRPYIKFRLKSYAQSVDDSVRIVNSGISHTKSPGLAASGTRLKEELRSIKALFESINMP